MPELSTKRRFLVLVMCSLFGVSCSVHSDSGVSGKKPISDEPVLAEAMIVELKVWPQRVRTQGSLGVDESVSVGTKVAGRVSQVHADFGDRVAKHAPIISIDDEQYRLLVAQADSQLSQARSAVGLKDGEPLEKLNPENAAPVREAKAVWDETKQAVERIRRLSQQNAVSATDLEVAEAAERVAAARMTSAQNSVREKLAMIGVQTAQLGLARQNLADTVVYAPFDGLMQERQVGVGTFVQAGQPMATIVSTSPLRFRASVPERYASQLRIGQKVHLQVELSRKEIDVEISRLSPTLDPASRALGFEALVDNADQSLRPGLFAEAEIVLDPDAQAVVVPSKAIVRFAGVDKVWIVDNDKVRPQPIRLGRQENDWTEITYGLSEGDRILVDGSQGRAGRWQASDDEEP